MKAKENNAKVNRKWSTKREDKNERQRKQQAYVKSYPRLPPQPLLMYLLRNAEKGTDVCWKRERGQGRKPYTVSETRQTVQRRDGKKPMRKEYKLVAETML